MEIRIRRVYEAPSAEDGYRMNGLLQRATNICILLAAIASAPLAPALYAEQPNIVFIISDDHDNEHLGFMGATIVHTPNLDRLAEAGTVSVEQARQVSALTGGVPTNRPLQPLGGREITRTMSAEFQR